MKATPYVGITGPVSIQETNFICNNFSHVDYLMDSPHIPMVGFLVSYKTLNNKPTKNRRYPEVNDLKTLLSVTENKVLAMIHYNSREMDTLAEQVSQIFNGIYENNLCKAIQLNIPWPDITQVSKIKNQYPEMQIVFQASHKAMEGQSPKKIAEGIKAYGDTISYVLIDPSGGKGIPFDLKSPVEIYSEIRNQCPDLTVGFAGGFTGENVVSRLSDIIREIGETEFCIDAEGGMRDKITEAYGDDNLNMWKVINYIKSASRILK